MEVGAPRERIFQEEDSIIFGSEQEGPEGEGGWVSLGNLGYLGVEAIRLVVCPGSGEIVEASRDQGRLTGG